MSDELDRLPDMMTTAEIAQFMRVNERTVRVWIETRDLQAFPIGKRGYRVSKSDLREFIDRRKRGLQNSNETK